MSVRMTQAASSAGVVFLAGGAAGVTDVDFISLVTEDAAATLKLYDGADASGDPVFEMNLPTTQDSKMSECGHHFHAAMFAVITGAGARAYFHYQ